MQSLNVTKDATYQSELECLTALHFTECYVFRTILALIIAFNILQDKRLGYFPRVVLSLQNQHSKQCLASFSLTC